MATTKKKTAKKTSEKSKPELHELTFTGILYVKPEGKKINFHILKSEEDARRCGMPKKMMKSVFAGWFGPSACTLSVNLWGGTVSCPDWSTCPGTQSCRLFWNNGTGWKKFGLNWDFNTAAAYQCMCV
jgi:hypothetical protein